MSMQAMARVVALCEGASPETLSPLDRLLLLLLADRHNPDEGQARPSVSRLARAAGVSTRQTQRALSSLEAGGYLRRVARHGHGGQGQLANGYLLIGVDYALGGDMGVTPPLTPMSPPPLTPMSPEPIKNPTRTQQEPTALPASPAGITPWRSRYEQIASRAISARRAVEAELLAREAALRGDGAALDRALDELEIVGDPEKRASIAYFMAILRRMVEDGPPIGSGAVDLFGHDGSFRVAATRYPSGEAALAIQERQLARLLAISGV